MLRAKDITAEERMELSKQLFSIRNDLNNLLNKNSNDQQVHEIEISQEEKESRRQFLANNPGLRDTFRAIWMVFVPYTDDGILGKEGYLKFQQVIHVALIGSSNNTILEDVSANIEKDLSHDNAVFGPLNEEAFYDLMFETLGESQFH
jgi:hypothetical protein